jgi:hypothetical protein
VDADTAGDPLTRNRQRPLRRHFARQCPNQAVLENHDIQFKIVGA